MAVFDKTEPLCCFEDETCVVEPFWIEIKKTHIIYAF